MNLLITGAWNDAKLHIPEIENMGHNVVFMQQEKDALPCDYKWPEAVICNGLFLYHGIKKFVNLKQIQLTSAGYDRVPMDYVKSHNIKINNAKGVYSIPMAEFAIGGVLGLCKQSRFFYENQKKHIWEKNRNLSELNGKTVVIVGCGNVGTECAKRFNAFGCKIIGIDLFPRIDTNYAEMHNLDFLDDVLSFADVLVLTVPLTDETHHLINKERLLKLKNTAIVVNIARGAVVDTKALTDVLPNIGGAVLDVFEEEPLNTTSPLWDADNVILTPHNSFVGENNGLRLWRLIVTNFT